MHIAMDMKEAPVAVTISAPGEHVACPFRAEGLTCGGCVTLLHCPQVEAEAGFARALQVPSQLEPGWERAAGA